MLDFSLIEKKLEEYINERIQILQKQYDEQVVSNNPKALKEFQTKCQMIQQKVDHTKRVVEGVSSLASKMNMRVNFQEIVKVCGLLHDIGRFNQAVQYANYNDSMCFPNGKTHADAGYEILTKENGFDSLEVPNLFRPTVATAVQYHQAQGLPPQFDSKLTEDFIKNTDPNEHLSGSYDFNEYELRIIALLLQMIRDIDKVDILYQRSIGAIRPFKEFAWVNNHEGIEATAKRFGISESIIRELNSKEQIESGNKLQIPNSEIPIEKLFVSDSVKQRMYNSESINLADIQKEDDYTFITALWWSIYTFLKDINFVGNLEMIKEQEILDKIYNQYPPKYRPVIDEIFAYAKEYLIDETLDKNKGNMYISR